MGTKATLTAVPDSGYAFSYWTGDFESMENPLVFRVDIPKSVTAVFAPLPITFESVVSGTNGVALAWNNLAWATHYLLYRGITSVPSSAEVLADIPNTGDCTYLDETGELEEEYWYWVEAEGVEDSVTSDPMTGKKRLVWPAAKSESEVAAVLAEAADARLGERLKSVAEYEAFRAWITEKGLEPQEVKDSAHAWISYALGAEGLFENEPAIVLGAVSVEGGGASVGVSVSVKDGERDAEVDAAKVAGMFEATGSLVDWEGDAKLSATATPTGSEGVTMQFEVVPGDGTARAVFLRIAP